MGNANAVSKLGITSTSTIGTKQFNELWEKYDPKKDKISTQTAFKFLKDFSTTIKVPYDKKKAGALMGQCDPNRTGYVGYDEFRILLVSASEQNKMGLTKSLKSPSKLISKTPATAQKVATTQSSGKKKKKSVVEEEWQNVEWENSVPRIKLPKLGVGQGLMSKKNNAQIVLKSMNVNVEIVDVCVQVEFTQVYKNDTNDPIEALYLLVLPLKTAISGFEVTIDGKKIKGIVKEKEEAANTYEDAIASGRGGYMVEKTDTKEVNEFKISVGNLAPNKTAEVHISFLTTTYNIKGYYVFFLPAELLPADAPNSGTCHLKMSDNIIHVFTTRGKVSHDKTSISWNETDSNHEMAIVIYTEQFETPRAILEVNPENNSQALMVTNTPIWPNFNPDLQESQVEVIFIVDRSGSMSGARMNQTKMAMNLLIHALPPNCKFNVIGFGDSQDYLFPESVLYGEKNLKKAEQQCSKMSADLGGTNLLSPLRRVYKTKPEIEYPRIILVITDGEVDDREGTIAEVRRHAGECRVYSLGISKDVDRKLVFGISQVGGGESALVVNNNDIEETVMNLFSKALQPCTRGISIEWPSKNYLATPYKIPPVFQGDRMVAYALLETEIDSSTALSISAVDPMGQTLVWKVPLIQQSGFLVHKLAAYSLIKDVEAGTSQYHASKDIDKSKIKEIITNLGIKYQLATKYTSFVAVDETNDEATTGSLKTVNVSTQLPPKQKKTASGSISGSDSGSDSGTGSGTVSDVKECGIGSDSSSGGYSGESSNEECGDNDHSEQEDKSDDECSGESEEEKEKEKEIEEKQKVYKKIEIQANTGAMISQVRSVQPKASSSNRKASSDNVLLTKKEKKAEEKKDVNSKKKIEKDEDKKEEKKESKKEREIDEVKKEEKVEEKKGAKDKKDETKAEKKSISSAITLKGKNENEQKGLIVSYQKFDGSWDLNEIASLFAISKQQLEQENPNVTKDVWATALGIAFLEVVLQKSKSTWQMVAKKAKTYITKSLLKQGVNNTDVTNTVDKIIDTATKFVKSNRHLI